MGFCSFSLLVGFFMIIICNLMLSVSLFHFGHAEAGAFGHCFLGTARGGRHSIVHETSGQLVF